MKFNIKADHAMLPLAIRQILFLNRIERKIEEREQKEHAEILVEDAIRWEEVKKEWTR